MKRILIAIPTARHIEPETFKSIYDLEVPSGYSTDFAYFGSYQVDYTRNHIAAKAREYDYLLAVDSDMTFGKDTLSKLLSHDKDIVSGLYIKKSLDKTEYEIYTKVEGRFKPYTRLTTDQLFEVDACGFGCVLVKSSVFASLEYPAFRNTWLDPNDFGMTEDLYFCRLAKQNNFKIWVDPKIYCGHIGLYTYK